MLFRNYDSLAFACALLFACGDAGDVNNEVDAGPAIVDANTVFSDSGTAPVNCEADHRESLDSSNNGIVNEDNQIEPTGLVISGQNDFSICGQIDPTQAGQNFDDVDVYSFMLSGDQNLRLHLQTDQSEALSEVELALFGAEGPTAIASGLLQGQHALIGRNLPAGLYWIAVFAKTKGTTDPIGYRIDVTKSNSSCDNSGMIESSYWEAADGQDSRNNDTFSVNYNMSANFRRTMNEDDSPEETKASIAKNSKLTISGTAANIPALDDYKDRDSYSITTGPTTEELSLRLRWDRQTSSDLDMHIFAAGEPIPDLSFGGSSTVGSGSDEVTTLAVLPNTEYWLWVGQYDNSDNTSPQNYQLEVCGTSLSVD